ncbi:MAG: hypothetical protein HFF50_06315 [Lawsonibacter sp.]|nr:hypothetical protein [Lawsonibacter sp.]
MTRSRSIRTDSPTFTRLVLGSPDLRRALASSPGEKLKVAACPEQTELHLLTVTGSGGFGEGYLGDLDLGMYGPERRKAALEAYFSSDFLPRMDQFLALLRALRDAVTQWPVPEK